MILKVNIKPRTIIAPSKNAIISKITDNKVYRLGYIAGFSFNGYGQFSDDNTITVYNLHKVRRKTQQIGKNGKKLKKSKIIRNGHWVAYVYTFDVKMLKNMGFKSIKQNTRNFTLV